MIDPSFCVRIDLSDLRRQPSLMSDDGLGDWHITLLTNDKLPSETGVDVKHGDVVRRRCLCFLLFMVFPLDEIALRIPPGCDAMKYFCTVVLNSSAWCLLISVTATWPVMVLYYRLLDDDVSGWEYFCSSVHILRRSDTSSCLSFDRSLCVVSFGPRLLVRRWIHIIIKLYYYYYNQGNQWAESKLGRRQPTQQLDQHWARCPWDGQ